ISENYFMPMSVFPALAYTFGKGVMPRINLIVSKFKRKYQLFLSIVLIIIEIIIFSLLTIYGWEYFIDILNSHKTFTVGVNQLPLSYVAVFVSIGFGLVVIEQIFLLVKNIKYSTSSFVVKEVEQKQD